MYSITYQINPLEWEIKEKDLRPDLIALQVIHWQLFILAFPAVIFRGVTHSHPTSAWGENA